MDIHNPELANRATVKQAVHRRRNLALSFNTKKFEVYAWLVESVGIWLNDHSRGFVCCVIPHLYHIVQGKVWRRVAIVHISTMTSNNPDAQTGFRHTVVRISFCG